MLRIWVCLVAVALASGLGAAEPKGYVSLSLEIRGVLEVGDKSITVKTTEKVETLSPGKDFGLVERAVSDAAVTWQLKGRDAERFKEAARKLNGKTVIVTGAAPLVWVHVEEGARGGFRVPPQSSWRVDRTLTVTDLKEAKD